MHYAESKHNDTRLECLRLLVSAGISNPHDLVAGAKLLEVYLKNEMQSPAVEDKSKAAKARKESVAPLAEAPISPTSVSEKEEVGVTYKDVKAAVLEVAKLKGREASLDLLTKFNNDQVSIVTGAGTDRKGNISSLLPEQYARVVDEATKVLA